MTQFSNFHGIGLKSKRHNKANQRFRQAQDLLDQDLLLRLGRVPRGLLDLFRVPILQTGGLIFGQDAGIVVEADRQPIGVPVYGE